MNIMGIMGRSFSFYTTFAIQRCIGLAWHDGCRKFNECSQATPGTHFTTVHFSVLTYHQTLHASTLFVVPFHVKALL